MTLPDMRALALFGTEQTEREAVHLSAGPLSAELEAGGLRYIRYGEQEVIRAISFLARDENWGTYALDLGEVEVRCTAESFDVRFHGVCGPQGTELRIAASITGHADGRLSFTVQARLEGDLLTNRTGFVVLHPLDVSSKPVIVETVDGARRATVFPERIDPLQPFVEIRALTTQHSASLAAEVRMEGDTFEMEDQRNWSDASFKTYVRPLAQPWPYTLAQGSSFTQSVDVTVRLSAAPVHAASRDPKCARVTRGVSNTDTPRALPELGLGVRAEHLGDALRQDRALRILGPAYFIAHLDLRHDDIERALAGFAQLSDRAGMPYVLEAVLTADGVPATELARLAAAVRPYRAPAALQAAPAPDLKAVLPGSPWPRCASFEEIIAAARAAFPGIPLGAGSLAYFTELNRKRPPAALLDYVTFTTCPIVHAADDRSVMETLETLPFIARSAVALFGSVPYRVGPSAIAARDNPYGAATLPNQGGTQGRRICLTDEDPRQRALFGAAWNLGYFARFAAGGATHIALSELTGPRGMFDGARPTPLFHLFSALGAWQGASMVELKLEQGAGQIAALAAQRDGRAVLWLANLSAGRQRVALELSMPSATIARWTSDSDFSAAPAHAAFIAGAGTPNYELSPYEVVEIRHAT